MKKLVKLSMITTTFLMLILFVSSYSSMNNIKGFQDSSLVYSSTTTYTLVDTGQDRYYDDSGNEISCPQIGEDYYGQDAQYDGIQPSYQDNGDGTVTDLITGLMWQQTPTTQSFSWQEALDYCEDLSLAGYDDWRTPSLKELFSIQSYESGWPYIDTSYFDLAGSTVDKDQQYWTSNFYYVGTTHGGAATAFGVNHGTGHIKGYPSEAYGPMGNYVRAVRGDTYGENDFVDNGDDTVTDQATGLTWQAIGTEVGMDWEAALIYAESLELGGYDDWRLPNIKELQSIVDYSGVFPAINSTLFNCTSFLNEAGDLDYGYFWSSTSAYFGTNSPEYYYAWYTAFGYGVDNDGNDTHGAGCVRFDVKEEDGPAGEGGERVLNYVRCVRGGTAEVQTEGPEPTQLSGIETPLVIVGAFIVQMIILVHFKKKKQNKVT